MTDRELMQMALDALEYERKANNPLDWSHDNAIEALRAALAQPEPEPVAWKYETPDYASLQWKLTRGDWRDGTWTPLYTTPPQHKWQGLTEAERIDILDAELTTQNTEHFALAQAIEDKLKEKNI